MERSAVAPRYRARRVTPDPRTHRAPPSGELDYYRAIGEIGRAHALNKPYSDPDLATQLMQLGAVLRFFPAPPADILECGCGPGWLSKLFAKAGYRATGVDVAPEAIELARSADLFTDATPPRFEVAAAESLPFRSEFDVVVYFDALHHVDDEAAAIASAFRALRPGGALITSEPGRGHHDASRDAVERYGVTEKDMPAHRIAQLAQAAGFADVAIHPRADELGQLLYAPDTRFDGVRGFLRSSLAGRTLLATRRMLWTRRDNGVVVARKH
jgi:SAM-dependent methyltransferase